MQWRPLVSIYESRLWRRSPLVAAATGLTFDREYNLLAQGAELERTRALLDVACGTGLFTRRFASQMTRGHTIGLDISRPMLEYAV